MAAAAVALGNVASPSTLAIGNGQVTSLQRNMEAVSFSPRSVFWRGPIESSSFLGERVTCPPSTSVQNGALVVRRGEARVFMGPDSRMKQGGYSGRIIFTPFGPMFTPNSGRGRNGRGEWEHRNRFQEGRIRGQREMMQRQQARLRKMIEAQLRNGSQERDMALLRELERRLRAEAGRQEGGATQQSDIDELMKQLEERLRPQKKTEEDATTKTDQQLPQYSTVYDFLNAWLKEWDQGMKEERERLQKQWEKSNQAPEQPSQAPEQPSRDSEPQENPIDSSSTAKQQDQVYTPEELLKAEEEAKNENQKEDSNDKSSTQAPSDGTVVYLKNEANGAELYLIGTSHISQQSVEEVRDVIQKVKPDYVMVELDRKRYNSMMQTGRDNPFAFIQQMVQTLANGNINAVGKLMGMGLSGFYRLLSTRGLQPGREMKVALEEAKKVGAKVVLGDQDIDITMKRFGEQMSMSDALQFFSRPMPSNIAQKMGGASSRGPGFVDPAQMFEQLRDRKIVREFNQVMERDAPAFTRILLDERNEAMTKALRNLSGKVVGVVGLAHLDGIEQLWREANAKYLNESA